LNALAAAPEATCEAMSRARIGQPAYPEEGATLVLQVARLAPNADGEPGSLRVSVSGPGVDGVARFAAEGLPPVVLRALRSINREYPLGVETILAAGERVVSLPRSAAVDWE
jgi:alpha-D-ribose 1-methylphosphonate 5-triphosphate synthase subunit PhnH